VSRRAAILLIVLLAVGVRVGAVLWTGHWQEDPGHLEYRTLATQLVAGEGYTFGSWNHLGPSTVRTPPYTVLVAALLIVGEPWAWLGLHLLNAAAAGVAAWAAMQLVPGRWGVVAGLAVALWPASIFAATHAQPGVIVAAMLLLMLLAWRRGWPTGGSMLGALAAAALPWVLPGVLLGSFAAGRRAAGVCLLTLGLLTLPWLTRAIVLGDLGGLPTSSLWVDAWQGHNPNATGGPWTPGGLSQIDAMPAQQRGLLQNRPEAERATLLRQWAAEHVAADPAKAAQLTGIKAVKWLTFDWHDGRARHPLYAAGQILLAMLAVAAVPIGLWKTRPAAWVWLGLLIVPMLTLVWSREQHVAAPVLIVLALGLLGRATVKDRAEPLP
jgi:hypothetical protein